MGTLLHRQSRSTYPAQQQQSRTTGSEVTTLLTAVILDPSIPAPGNQNGRTSLLDLPFGTTTLFKALPARFGITESTQCIGVSDYSTVDVGGPGSRCGDQSDTHIRSRVGLRRWFETRDVSDSLLIIDARYWPIGGHAFAPVLSASRAYRGATYVIGVGQDEMGLRERLKCDGEGRVRRIQRFYNLMDWPQLCEVPFLCALVPARLLEGADLTCLAALRSELIEKNVFTHDVPMFSAVHDLTTAHGLLDASEEIIEQALRVPAKGYSMRGPGVMVGEGCRIDPSARLVAPIILQDGAVIGRSCMVIGPTVIGAHGIVQEQSSVTRCLVGSHAVVRRGTRVCESIVTSEQSTVLSSGEEFSTATSKQDTASYGAEHLSFGKEASARRRAYLAVKRVFDTVLAVIALVVFSPLFGLIAILIKRDSPGPVFFRHRRESIDGRAFSCVKFRTMVADAHRQQLGLYDKNEMDGPQFKLSDDPRVTRVGQWLRRANLDELPQLLNVVAGDMSLVGPRPSPFRENQICVPWRRGRLSVLPGITGLWQLCRTRRAEGDFHQWIFYDLAYVRNLSFWLDLKILFYTVWTMGGRHPVPLSRLIRTTSNEQDHP